MTFDEDRDAFDPLIAERFELLNRAEPIEVPHEVTYAMAQVGHRNVDEADQPTMLTPRPDPYTDATSRPLYLLIAAAALVVAAGGAIFALSSIGDDPDLQAGDEGTAQQQGDEQGSTADGGSANDSSDPAESLTVEVPETTVTASTVEGTTETQDDSDNEEAAATSETGTKTEASEAATGESGSAQEAESQGTAAETGPTETNNPPAESSTIATPVPTTAGPTTEATTAVPSTTDLAPGSSWLSPPVAEKMVSVRGTVTEVFTDCHSRLILNDQNEVESVGPISCDGGSYIIVGGTRIQTTSGFLMSEADMFGKHPAALRPGQVVSVTAVPTASAGGMLTLDCVLCEVSVGG